MVNFSFLGFDVSVTMLDKFQQSMLEKLGVPRIQFLDRLVDIPVGLRWRCTVHTAQRTVEFHSSRFLGMVLTCPLLCNDKCRG